MDPIGIDIEVLGGAGMELGSKYILKIRSRDGSYEHMIDCGTEPGEEFSFPRGIKSITIGHSHGDHMGGLAAITGNIPIFATKPTLDITENQLDSLLRKDELEAIMDSTVPILTATNNPIDLGIEGIRMYLKMFESGHMPGAVTQRFDFIFEPHNLLRKLAYDLSLDQFVQDRWSLLYTPDLGRLQMETVEDFPFMKSPDFRIGTPPNAIIIDATTGYSKRQSFADTVSLIEEKMKEIAESGGKLIIPVSSVMVPQVVLYSIYSIRKRFANIVNKDSILNPLWNIPVYVSVPRCQSINQILLENLGELDLNAKMRFLGQESPFSFHRLEYVETPEEDRRLLEKKGPYILLVSTPDCQTGRSKEHVKRAIEDQRNIIFFPAKVYGGTVGFSVANSAQGGKVRIDGEEYAKNAEVITLNKGELSLHVSGEENLQYITKVAPPSSRPDIYITHGTPSNCLEMKTALVQAGYNPRRITIMENGKTYGLLRAD